MSVVDSSGATLTKSQLEGKTTTVTRPVLRKISDNIYEKFTLPGSKNFETDTRLLYVAGQVVAQADIDALYESSEVTFESITPAEGNVAGGTDVTIKGTGFGGTSGASLGGVALTEFKVVNDTTLTGKTGAHAAGAVDLVITDASGNVTEAGAFTYTE